MVVVSDKQPLTLRAAHNISSALVLLKAASRCAISRDMSIGAASLVMPSASLDALNTVFTPQAILPLAPFSPNETMQNRSTMVAASTTMSSQMQVPLSPIAQASIHRVKSGATNQFVSAEAVPVPTTTTVTPVRSIASVVPVASNTESVGASVNLKPAVMPQDVEEAVILTNTKTIAKSAIPAASTTNTKDTITTSEAKSTIKGSSKKAARQSASASSSKHSLTSVKTSSAANRYTSTIDPNASLLEAAARANSIDGKDDTASHKIQVEVIATKQESGIKIIKGRKAGIGAAHASISGSDSATTIASVSANNSSNSYANSANAKITTEPTSSEVLAKDVGSPKINDANFGLKATPVSPAVAASPVASVSSKTMNVASELKISASQANVALLSDAEGDVAVNEQAALKQVGVAAATASTDVNVASTDKTFLLKEQNIASQEEKAASIQSTSTTAKSVVASTKHFSEPKVSDSFAELLPDESVIGAPENSLINAGGALGLNNKESTLDVASMAIIPVVSPVKVNNVASANDEYDHAISDKAAAATTNSSLTVTPSTSSLFAKNASLGSGLELVSATDMTNEVIHSSASNDFSSSSDLSMIGSLSNLSKLSTLSTLSNMSDLSSLSTEAGVLIEPSSSNTKESNKQERGQKLSGSLNLTGLS